MTAAERPILSVVVACVSDTTGPLDLGHLAACLTALGQQVDAPPVEVIVPVHDGMAGIDEIKRQFPAARYIPVADLQMSTWQGGSREHHDVLRARGIAAARGEFVALIEDFGFPDERWCTSLVAALRSGYAGVGGAMENKIDRPLNWSVYYCDYGRYQNPLPAGPSARASDANVAYTRPALESIRSTWETSFHEDQVNGALIARGQRVGLVPEAIVYQNRAKLGLGQALRERFVWGRSYAANRMPGASTRQRLVYAALSPVLPLILLARMTATSRGKGRLFSRFVRALPITALLVTAWSAGEGIGYVVGHRPAAR